MIIPAGHRVLIRPDSVEEITKGGIVLPKQVQDAEQNATIMGTIVALGGNAWKAFDDGNPWANVGDRVGFAKYGGMIVTDPDTQEKLRILNDEDITFIIK